MTPSCFQMVTGAYNLAAEREAVRIAQIPALQQVTVRLRCITQRSRKPPVAAEKWGDTSPRMATPAIYLTA